MLKKINMKTIIVIVLIIIISSLAFLFSKKNIKKTEENISLFPDLSIPSFVEGKYNISFDIKKDSVNLPKELPYLEKKTLPPLTKNESALIAKKLGFLSDPLNVNDVINGEILIWNSETNFLTVTLKERKIKYGPNYNPVELIQRTSSLNLTEEEMEVYVLNYLKEKLDSFIVNPTFSNYVYLKPEVGLELFQKTDKEKAQIFQLNFNEGNLNYPILTLNPQDTSIYVQILKDKTILNMEAFLISATTESEQKYQTKSYEEIILDSPNAEIVSINNGNVNLSDINSSDIDNISISNINIAYYLKKQSDEYFQPVYVLEGRTTIKGFNSQMPVVLYLPAFK